MSANLSAILYLVSGVLFILASTFPGNLEEPILASIIATVLGDFFEYSLFKIFILIDLSFQILSHSILQLD